MFIRRAENDDLSALLALQNERIVLLQQSDARFVPPTLTIEHCLSHVNAHVWVGVDGESVAAYALCWEHHSPYGTLAESQLLFDEMALDAHKYHAGLGRALVNHIRVMHSPRQLIAAVPRYHAVEQAFWRALGAKPCSADDLKRSPFFEWMCL